MDELTERVSLLRASGFVDESGERDLDAAIGVLSGRYGLPASDDVLGALVTHIAVALKRARTGVLVEKLSAASVEQMQCSEVYQRAHQIQKTLSQNMENPLSSDEQEYVLVHLCGILLRTDERR